jgi:hypothetical protein
MNICIGLLYVVTTILGAPNVGGEGAAPTIEDIIQNVNTRDIGVQATNTIRMTLKDKKGKELVRESQGFRKYYGDEKRSLNFVTKPAKLRNFGLLTFDYGVADKSDDAWAYLPDMRKVRRISTDDRGATVLGTDFTVQDMKNESRISNTDYAYTIAGIESVEDQLCHVLEALPVSDAIAKELGYSKTHIFIDAKTWVLRKADFWDVEGEHLKTITMHDIEEVDGIWTARRIFAKNHQNDHSTLIEVLDIDYTTELDDDMFTERSLRRGIRGK